MPMRVLEDNADFTTVIHGTFPDTDEKRRAIRWDPRIVSELMSGSAPKLMDNIRGSRNFEIHLRSINMDAFAEESEEKEPTFAYIALGKIAVSGKPLEEMNEQEEEALCRKLGVPDKRYILMVSEDRGQFCDPRLKDCQAFDPYRDNPLVKEIFEDGAPFPGHRFKELQSLMGGLGPYQEALNMAYTTLPLYGSKFHGADHYRDLSREHSEHIAYAFKPLVPSEIIPMDPDGIVIEITQKRCRMIPMAAQEIERERTGKQTFEGFNFVRPHGQDDSMENLRQDHGNPWFERHSYWAKAWETFCHLYNVPLRDKPLTFEPLSIPDASFMVIGNPDRRAIKDLNGERRPVPYDVCAFESPAIPLDWETQLATARGAVLLPYKNLEQEIDRALALAEQLRAASALITLKSLYDPLMSGCPIVVGDRGLADKLKFLTNIFYQHKFFAAKPDEMFVAVTGKNKRSLALTWDPLWYKELDPASLPVVSLCDSQQLEKITGVADWGYARCVLLTGSCPNAVVISEAEIAGYDSAVHGETVILGGGTRYGMGAVTRGAAQAFHDGYRGFRQHGERWSTVAMKEGSTAYVPEAFRLAVTQGDIDGEFVRFEDFLTYHLTDSYAGRKHVIIGLSLSALGLGGGFGTFDELMDTAVHNCKVLKYGEGHYPGFSDAVTGNKNKLQKPIRLVDSHLQAGRQTGFFSAIAAELFSPRQHHIMNMHFYGNALEALREDRKFGRDLGYEIERRAPVERPSGIWLLQGSPSPIR